MVSSLSRERGRNSEQIWTPPLGEPTAFLNVGIIIPLSSEKMREDIVSSYSKNENLCYKSYYFYLSALKIMRSN